MEIEYVRPVRRTTVVRSRSREAQGERLREEGIGALAARQAGFLVQSRQGERAQGIRPDEFTVFGRERIALEVYAGGNVDVDVRSGARPRCRISCRWPALDLKPACRLQAMLAAVDNCYPPAGDNIQPLIDAAGGGFSAPLRRRRRQVPSTPLASGRSP